MLVVLGFFEVFAQRSHGDFIRRPLWCTVHRRLRSACDLFFILCVVLGWALFSIVDHLLFFGGVGSFIRRRAAGVLDTDVRGQALASPTQAQITD